MFEVIEDPQFVEDVTVHVPDGSGWKKEILRTRFRALPISEVEALEADGGALAVLDRAVVAFEDLGDKNGKPVEGDGPWRARLLQYAFVRTALILAYYAAQSGVRMGNSGPSAVPGPGAS